MDFNILNFLRRNRKKKELVENEDNPIQEPLSTEEEEEVAEVVPEKQVETRQPTKEKIIMASTAANDPLLRALSLLRNAIENSVERSLGKTHGRPWVEAMPFEELKNGNSPLSKLLIDLECTPVETFVILLALAPHLAPSFLDQVIADVIPKAGDFPQLGGVRGKNFRGFLPTGETAMFILAADDFRRRFYFQDLFSEDHFFAKLDILRLEEPEEGEPKMSGKIIMSQEYVELLTHGKLSRPKFSMHFPARRIETEQLWEDLVLNDSTLIKVKHLETFLQFGPVLLEDWKMRKKLKPGYRALFHGPPGTGKTMTASLLGKYTGRDVYKVDLSMVVSKYIGETEKNLNRLFAKAENKNWILFFDEADALFGKRTNVKDAHDKYANQEVSFLLQRIEDYDGLTILASNYKNNMDDAFMRRFQSVIHFPMPTGLERLMIWKKAFPYPSVGLDPEVDLSAIANKYELSGSGIMNVVQYCCLKTLERGDRIIRLHDLMAGIRAEFEKSGKITGRR